MKKRDPNKAKKPSKAHGFTKMAHAKRAKKPAKKLAARPHGDEALWRQARAKLIDNDKNHFQHRMFYAIRDPALIDPILQRILDQKYGGKLTRAKISKVANRARGSYGALKQTEAGRAWLEQRMEDHYASPPTQVKGNQLIVDYGIPPGKFEHSGRGGWSILATRVALGISWKGTEVAAAFKRLGAKHKQTVIILKIRIPTGTHTRFWTYRWIRHQDRIAVKRGDMPNRVYVTGKLGHDLGPYVSGEKSLQPKDLKLIRTLDMIWGDEKDAPM